MRTIKFRAWEDKAGMMSRSMELSELMVVKVETWFSHFGWEMSNLIWMQFTGLLDKNGKEIYDGDILHSYGELFSNFGQYPTGKYATSIYKVVWVGDGWGHKTLKSKTQVIGYESRGLKVMASLTDVIGNIYENPELLKEE